MKLLLLVADQPGQLTQLRELLGPENSLFTAASIEEGLDYLRMTRVDVVVAAFTEPDISVDAFLQQTKILQPHCSTLYIAPPYQPGEAGAERSLPSSDFLLRRPFHREELLQVVRQATAKQRLDEELDILRGQGAVPLSTLPQAVPVADREAVRFSRVGPILRNFTKAFSANFDLQRTLIQFLDAIGEFVQPSRQSVMVWNPASRLFEIRAERGLPPQVIGQLNLPRDGGLAEWLWREGRLIQRDEVERQLHKPAYMDIYRDMQALKAAVCIPLLSSGSLLGILNLGDRVTGGAYLQDELEILFSLASHIAVGIQDIALHHEVQAQKVFTEKILRYMGSGVITIDTDEMITLCNHRAAEILSTTWAEAQSAHVRVLTNPTPGDRVSKSPSGAC
jgi:GAF domain-containing protein